MPARSVTSNQTDIYKNLEEVVRKYATTSFLRPVADHTREAFERACEFVRKFNGARDARIDAGCEGGCAELVLDSGCGTGESSIHLARRFPNIPVIGIDKSAERLTKAGNEHQLENAMMSRPECSSHRMSSGSAQNSWTFGALR